MSQILVNLFGRTMCNICHSVTKRVCPECGCEPSGAGWPGLFRPSLHGCDKILIRTLPFKWQRSWILCVCAAWHGVYHHRQPFLLFKPSEFTQERDPRLLLPFLWSLVALKQWQTQTSTHVQMHPVRLHTGECGTLMTTHP